MAGNLREVIANVLHQVWAHWMAYLFSVCEMGRPDGGALIPRDKLTRWVRQMNTCYAALPDEEKRSDREQATRILSAIGEQLPSMEEVPEDVLDEVARQTAEAICADTAPGRQERLQGFLRAHIPDLRVAIYEGGS